MKDDKDANIVNYGEFVCSEFLWLPSDVQKDKAKEMDEMTQNDTVLDI